MSYFNYQLLHKSELKEGSGELPSKFQLGDEVVLYFEDANGVEVDLTGYVVGCRVQNMHAIHYDIALPLKGSDEFYVVVKDIRGWIKYPNEESLEDGGLVDADELMNELVDSLTGSRVQLHIVD